MSAQDINATPVPATSECSTCSLLTWKDPVKTGKVFGSIVAALLVLKTVNLFNLFFRLAYIGLLGMFSFSTSRIPFILLTRF